MGRTYPLHFIADSCVALNSITWSQSYREAAMKIAASSSTDIAIRLSNEREKNQKFNRTMLMKVLSCICYLARQGLPLRGSLPALASSR